MYESIKTRAIVLKKYSYLEKDCFVDLFCEKLGRISIFAKSLRDIKNKLNGKFESFSQIDILLEARNDKFVLRDVKVEKYLNQIATETVKFAIASSIAEMTIFFTPQQQIIDGYFELLQESFEFLSSSNKEELIKIAFYSKALKIMGFLNIEKTCHHCTQKIANDFIIQTTDSTICCIECFKNMKNSLECLKFNFHSLKLFNFLQVAAFHEINKIILPNDLVIKQTENLIKHLNYLREHKNLKSELFWRDIQKFSHRIIGNT